MAARALAMEVAESMANTSNLLLIPTTDAAYTPQSFMMVVRYKKEMRIISSWKEMGMPTFANFRTRKPAGRKQEREESKIKLFFFK